MIPTCTGATSGVESLVSPSLGFFVGFSSKAGWSLVAVKDGTPSARRARRARSSDAAAAEEPWLAIRAGFRKPFFPSP
jgi:hypothetical protein